MEEIESPRQIGIKISEILLLAGTVTGAFFYPTINDNIKASYLSAFSVFILSGIVTYTSLLKRESNWFSFSSFLIFPASFAMSVLGTPFLQFVNFPNNFGFIGSFSILAFFIYLLLTFFDAFENINKTRHK